MAGLFPKLAASSLTSAFFNCSVVSYGNAHIAGIVGIIVSSYRSAVLAESVFDGGMALNDDLRVCVAVANGSTIF